MKPTAFLRSILAASSTLLALFFAGQAQAVTYTWSNLDNATPVANGNWSGGESWSAVPVSAADTTLSFGYTYGSNSTAETNTLTNDIANPFLLNVLTLGGATPSAGNGSQVALINIAGSPLNFVANAGLDPQVNLSQNRSNGQVVSFNVQSAAVLGANTLFTGNGTANFTVSGGISGVGSLTKGGTSKLTLSGTNSYAGTTTISGGTLQFTNQVSLYNNTPASWTAANISVASGATLALNVGGTGQFTATSVNTLLSNLGGANGSSTTGFAGGSTIALDTTGAGINVTGNIVNSTGSTGGGSLGVTKQGTNTLTLSGANTYTGTTTLNLGTLTLNPGANAQTIGNIALAHSGGDMTLNLDGTSTANTAGNITQTGVATNGNRSTLTKLATGTWTVGDITAVSTRLILQPQAGTLSVGQLIGGVDLRMLSTGTLQLRTAGNQGVGILNGGNNTVGLAGTINNSSAGLITFNLNPAIAVVGNFTLNGSSLNLGTGATTLGTSVRSITVTGAASTLAFGGAIANTVGGITKLGAGTLKLAGINNYTGATAVNAGTLDIAVGGSTHASSAVTVSNANSALIVNGTVNGTLLVNVSTSLSGTGTIAGAATINGTHNPGASPGLQNFSAGLTYGSTATLNAEFVGDTLGLRGTDYDGVNVTGGNLTIDSAATLALYTSSIDYTLGVWDSARAFTIIDFSGAGASTGLFLLDTTNAGSFASEGSWSLANTSNDIVLSWTAIPEPNIAALLGGGGMLALLRRRRRA